MSERAPGRDGEVDRDATLAVLEEHPVSLAILFGSTVRGGGHPRSDVDIAVEFQPGAPDTLDARLSLWADLSRALDRNDVDLAVVDELDPHVGARALEECELLVGSEERVAELHHRFERAAERRERASPGERFDAALERLERVMDG